MTISMKKFLAAGLFLVLCLGLVGCGTPEADNGENVQSAPQEETQKPEAQEPEAQNPEVQKPEVNVPEDPTRSEVYVVCEEDVTVRDKAYADYSYSTYYEYDHKGCLARCYQESNSAEDLTNLCRTEFAYDDNNRLIEVSNAFEQYDWNVGNTYTLTYDEQGRCDSAKFEIVSQGIGSRSIQYTYGKDGRIATGLFKSEDIPDEEPLETTLTWAYTDDGHIQFVESDDPNVASFYLDEEVSNIDQGKYVYTDEWGTVTELVYNEGLLSFMKRTSGEYIEERTFDYAVITVDTDTFVPTPYSNPTGFDLLYTPQVIK